MKLVFGRTKKWVAAVGFMVAAMVPVAVAQSGQQPAEQQPSEQQPTEQHGRKWKPLPPTSHIVVTVEKGFNGKPLVNAAVIFHAVREGKNDGNLEVKTDPEGKATIDVIEVGSRLNVQVIAYGFATYATDVMVDGPSKEMLVKMQRPRAQISAYSDNADKAAETKPGVQEPPKAAKPGAVTPQPVQPVVPGILKPEAPSTTPQGAGAPQAAGKQQ